MTGVVIIEGHVQGLSNTRSLGELGIPVYVIDKNNCLARYSKYCRKFFYCPEYLSYDFKEFLLQLAQKEDLKGWLLLPSNDHAIHTISRYKEELELFYRIATPDLNNFENIYDKLKLLEKARECGVPIPETYYFESIKDINPVTIKFPLITKGRNGLSFYKDTGTKVLFSENYDALIHNLNQIKDKPGITNTFTQELIPFNGKNHTLSFTAFCEEGNIMTYWMGVKLREHPAQFGTATFAESVNIQECYKQSIPLLRQLNYTGVCEIEYMYDPRMHQYKLIEINARTWLWVGLARACGVDYAKLLYNHANNIENKFPDSFVIGIKWINYLTDIVYGIKSIIKGKISLLSYISTLKGKKVHAVFSMTDILPGIMLIWLSFYLAYKRKIF